MLERGFTLDEAAAVRGLLPADILRHATLAIRQGRPLAAESLIAPETLRRWDAWHSEHGNASPPPGDKPPPGLWEPLRRLPRRPSPSPGRMTPGVRSTPAVLNS